ncbi:MAG: hypothetical protein GQ476_05375 [Candidatus Aminicenantes bacterium]|nr:hypothetical protein [Candidatus Aminicenantes bacterium]
MRLKGLSLKDFAIVISDYLIKNGIEVILTGGACVTIYTDNKYMSYDLDFVLISSNKQKVVKKLLLGLGFSEENRSFRHDDIEYFIEFVPPPLSVGEEPVKEIFKIKKGKHILKLLSPTDCVKDRLIAFYHWDDRQCLEQAILVCGDNRVDLEEVKRWSVNEGMSSKYDIFLTRL